MELLGITINPRHVKLCPVAALIGRVLILVYPLPWVNGPCLVLLADHYVGGSQAVSGLN